MSNLERWDKILGNTQKVLVILGILTGSFYVFWREDNSRHLELSVDAKLYPDCTIIGHLSVFVPKGLVVRSKSWGASVFAVDNGKISDLNIDVFEEAGSRIKVGEKERRVFATQLGDAHTRSHTAYVVRGFVSFKGSERYVDEVIVDLPKEISCTN
ncbi:MAG: hypothetical protein CML66_28930 [Rhodobacteraceae bacterium]|nr:hypothetical protein [Paracoccaceae bacterium]MAY45108.1 hypothetical protein [Paracoccaceae bacterium]